MKEENWRSLFSNLTIGKKLMGASAKYKVESSGFRELTPEERCPTSAIKDLLPFPDDPELTKREK